MTYSDTNYKRLKMLIESPVDNFKLIFPFLKSRLLPYYRNLLARFGIDKYAKQYSGHNILLKYINKKNGFFVQCGGNDGYGNDPTYYIEKILNWHGVIVEPLSIYKLCKKNRKNSKIYNTAIGSFENKGKLVEIIDCNAMSFVRGSIPNENEWISAGEKTQNIKSKVVSIQLQPIQDIIDEYFKVNGNQIIDLFVADVEGYELEVLKGLDFSKNPPTFLLLEVHLESRLKEIENYLDQRKYKIITKLGDADYLFKIN